MDPDAQANIDSLSDYEKMRFKNLEKKRKLGLNLDWCLDQASGQYT